MGRRLNPGASGVKSALTVISIAATVGGWAVLAVDDPGPAPAAAVGVPDTTAAERAAPAGPLASEVTPHQPPAAGRTTLAPLPELVSVDVRPLPPPPVRPRVDVRTRASRRLR